MDASGRSRAFFPSDVASFGPSARGCFINAIGIMAQFYRSIMTWFHSTSGSCLLRFFPSFFRVLLLSALFLRLQASAATGFPTGFSETLIASTMPSPTQMEIAPDGRVFVAQQAGALRVIKNGSLLPTPFLTLTVDNVGERGLLGIAFDPDFANTQYIYLYYTATTPASHNRVSRFTANGDVVVSGSEVVLLDLNNLSGASNHNGGGLHFGPDGKLYIAAGENALPSNSQTLTNLLGKILRINRDGTIPTDNPFYSTAVGVNRSIWAMGLRNPYTFAFQPGTGRLFINDVGQSSWEEINEGVAGANYGWPTCEGNCSTPNANFRDPLFAYPAGNGTTAGHAIAGGAFYNPTTVTFPSSYVGSYFFADYVNGWIRRLDTANGNTVSVFASGVGQPLDLKVAPDGTLYYLARTSGALYAVKYSPDQLPQIVQQPVSVSVPSGQSASFSIQASGTGTLTYQWQRNGVNIPGATGTSYALSSTALSDNGAQFRCLVTNAAGTTSSQAATLTVTSGALPVGTILTPVTAQVYAAGDTIQFSGQGTDKEDGTLPSSSMSWTIVFHHDTHTHPFLGPINGVSSGSFVIPTEGETAANVWYRVYLTVTDSVGQSHVSFVDITPRLARIDLRATMPGLQVTLDGQPVTTPYSVTSVVGMRRNVGVIASQVVNGATFDFATWSDAGSASHAIVSPSSDTAYEACFTLRRDPQTGSATFLKTSSLTIPALGTATSYPLSIQVAGLYGPITQLAVTLKGLNHTFPDDLDALLVSPSLQSVLLMSDVGGDIDLVNLDLGFNTASTVDLPDASAIASGNYRPTNFGSGDTFAAPAPAGPYSTGFAGVLSSVPKGNWNLYLLDDEAGDAGSLTRGWQITLTVSNTPPTISDLGDQVTDGIQLVPPIVFQVGDGETPASELSVSYRSSDQNLLPDSNLVLSGTGTSRTLQASPVSGKVGITTVTVTVSDGLATASDSFVLLVGDLNHVPTISSVPDQTIQQGTSGPSVSFNVDDAETAASNLVVTATSSNTGLIPQSGLVLSGTGNQRALTINPQPNQIGSATITLAVKDSAGASASNSFAVNVISSGAPSSRFSNSVAIVVPSVGAATPYPSKISVSGFIGTVGQVKVSLQGMNHTWPDDIQSLVVSPTGQKILLMSGAGGGTDLKDVTLVFDQLASGFLPDSQAITGGSFLPTLYGTTPSFPAGAPLGPYSTSLNDLVGTDPNGSWSLYVNDSAAGDQGTIATGWSLEISPQSTSTVTLSNTSSVTIPALGAAVPYPSTVVASGLAGSIDKLTVNLVGVSHTWPDDIAILLSGPAGQNIVLMARAGGNTALQNLNLSFDDGAAQALPDQSAISSGLYKPSVYGGALAFPVGAPAGPYSSLLGSAIGTSPNGVWSLYVMDMMGGDGGAIVGGWSLTIQSSIKAGSTQTFANSSSISLPAAGPATVYPSSILVSGMSGGVSHVTVKLLGFNHTWPDDFDVLLVGPRGQNVLLISDAGGNGDWLNMNLTLDDDATALLPDDTQVSSGIYKPTNYGVTDVFAAPAPVAPYGSSLAVFNGTDPNGTWSLYVLDDEAGDQGSLTGGWSLTVSTVVPPAAVPLPTSVDVSVSFEAVSLLPDGRARLSFRTTQASVVAVDYSSDLINWVELDPGLSVEGAAEFTDPTLPAPESRFYRLRLLK